MATAAKNNNPDPSSMIFFVTDIREVLQHWLSSDDCGTFVITLIYT